MRGGWFFFLCIFHSQTPASQKDDLKKSRRTLLPPLLPPRAQRGHQFELKWVRKSRLSRTLAFLPPHPLAAETLQKAEERMTNAAQSLQPSSALSQDSPGMLGASLLDVYVTAPRCCTVPGHDRGVGAVAARCRPPARLSAIAGH